MNKAYTKIDNLCCLNACKYQKDFFQDYAETDEDICKDVYEMTDCLEEIKEDLLEKENLDKHLDFSNGALMSGFDYKGQQIVAMPLEEYDKLMKKEKALVVLKDLFDFDFALRFPSNQPMLRIENKRTNEYWEIPVTKEEYDLLKEMTNNE